MKEPRAAFDARPDEMDGDDDRTLIQDPDGTLVMRAPPDADGTLVHPPPDPDGTLMMPRPGGQATRIMSRRAAAAAPKARPGVELQRLVAGINPLLGAAGVLLGLVAQLRATTSHADPAGLRRQLLARVAEFESFAAAQGAPRPKISAARYVLCSFLDEVVAATPWGADGVWAERNLLQEFHDERDGGAKAFELLDRLGEDPVANADLLELFYVCITLGFQGRFKGVPGGRAQLDAIAARVLEVVRPPEERALRTMSPRWQGVAARARRLEVVPLWAVLAVAGALVLGIALSLSRRLDDHAMPVFRQLHAVPVALRLERPVAAARSRLAPRLNADIAQGLVAVRDEAQRSVVTLPADKLFDGAGARIEGGQQALLGRIARALQGVPGQVAVIGHTDDRPIASLQFPSNWHLSQARARAVMAALVEHGERPARLSAEGRADAEPLAPESSDEARSRNRRIEIELRLPRPEG
jgi:type VI secretion system protein ImpK